MLLELEQSGRAKLCDVAEVEQVCNGRSVCRLNVKVLTNQQSSRTHHQTNQPTKLSTSKPTNQGHGEPLLVMSSSSPSFISLQYLTFGSIHSPTNQLTKLPASHSRSRGRDKGFKLRKALVGGHTTKQLSAAIVAHSPTPTMSHHWILLRSDNHRAAGR